MISHYNYVAMKPLVKIKILLTFRDGRICITIPSFYTVGLGKQSYVSYEINIKIASDVECEDADEFTLHRRYRTFRELHSSMCSR